eukprot:2226196-Prymnesium_polylepis.1
MRAPRQPPRQQQHDVGGGHASRGQPASAALRAAQRHVASARSLPVNPTAEIVDYDLMMQLHHRDNPSAHVKAAKEAKGIKPEALKAIKKSVAMTRDCDECSVCLERFEDTPVKMHICALPCDHLFHRRCITEWLKHDVRCPNCRFDLSPWAK